MPLVAVLMCTYNGQAFLAEQLDSIAGQTYGNWTVVVSDDGSQDSTLDLLDTYRQRWGEQRLALRTGPGKGFAANFLALTCQTELQADFYAFCDQDDMWQADKLQRALRWLDTVPAGVAAMYCSRTELVDDAGSHLGFSPLFTRQPLFANALVQSVGGGNTMVFNQAAMALLREAGENVDIVSHDWWLYQVVTGCGGQVFYDAVPSILYRQHEENVVGSNSSWSDRLARLRMMLTGRFKGWNDLNIAALSRLEHRLTEENRQHFQRFCASRQQWLLPRMLGLWRSGVYRQTVFGNLGLILAALIKRL